MPFSGQAEQHAAQHRAPVATVRVRGVAAGRVCTPGRWGR